MFPPGRGVRWDQPAPERRNLHDRDRVRRLRVSLSRTAEDIRELRRTLLEADDALERDRDGTRMRPPERPRYSSDSRSRQSVWQAGRKTLAAAETFLYRLRELQMLLRQERDLPRRRSSRDGGGGWKEEDDDECSDSQISGEAEDLDAQEREARDDEETRGPRE